MTAAAKPIGDLKLPKKIHNALTNAGYAFVHELEDASPMNLVDVVGGHGLQDIHAALDAERKAGA